MATGGWELKVLIFTPQKETPIRFTDQEEAHLYQQELTLEQGGFYLDFKEEVEVDATIPNLCG